MGKQKLEPFNLINRLHTDVLEEKYGKITAKVIRHDKILREAHLIDKKGISRTYAITFFTENKCKKIKAIDDEIKNSKPIGKAFREHGFQIKKNVIDVFIIKLPTWLKKSFNTKEKYAKARLSEFYAKNKDNPPIIYGTVVEIYSPDFRIPVINKIDTAQINPSTKAFEHVGVYKEEVWNKLSDETSFKEYEGDYEHAKKDSHKIVFDLKKKIQDYLCRKSKKAEFFF
jgi:hypothetical protein